VCRGGADRAELDDVLDELGYPAMLKTRTGGYDGRGNFPIESEADASDALAAAPGPALVEAFVDFEREVSVIGAKGDGEVATYPVGENVHDEEILRETVVPARTSADVAERADEVAREVLAALDGRGVYGIELFETVDGEILVNEIAPRPHNSGHYTIEACLTSQFEQHVRAVTGRPLGATDLRCPTVMTNVLGDVEQPEPAALYGTDEVLAARAANLHWYGKREVRPLRKMGHVTLLGENGDDSDGLLASARDLRDGLTFQS
jgi:5-(carboxyamino)imidazole ribonucleotide synthase